MTLITIQKDESDFRIDRWFRRKYSAFSFIQVVQFLRKSLIKVNSSKVAASYRLQEGDVVHVSRLVDNLVEKMRVGKDVNKRSGNKWSARHEKFVEKIRRTIIYSDSKLLIFNKDAGVAVQGGTSVSISIDDVSHMLVGGDSRDNGCTANREVRPKIVHRLDKGTSGVFVLAKTYEVAQMLSSLISRRMVKKRYVAIVRGRPKQSSGVINVPLDKLGGGGNNHKDGSSIGKSMEKNMPLYQDSVTHYSTICSNGEYSVLAIDIETGRKHQIRRHLTYIGCSVVGDKRYRGDGVGSGCNGIKGNCMYLHSHILEFALDGVNMYIRAELPHYFDEFVEHNFSARLYERYRHYIG